MLLTQVPAPVTLQDPTATTKAKVNSTSGGALQVYCVGGTCSGGGGSSSAQWTTIDGGYVGIWDGTDRADVTASGRLAVDGSGVTQPVSGTVNANQSGTWTVQPGNTANTTPWLTTDTPRTVASANNTGTCVSVTTSSTTVLASNGSRRAYGFKASEANTDRVYCKLGATATTSNMPFGAGSAWSQDTGAVYTGVVDCISGSGTQTVCAYELN